MEWQIIQVIVYIVSFLVTVVGFGIKLSSVIQKNTNAINNCIWIFLFNNINSTSSPMNITQNQNFTHYCLVLDFDNTCL